MGLVFRRLKDARNATTKTGGALRKSQKFKRKTAHHVPFSPFHMAFQSGMSSGTTSSKASGKEMRARDSLITSMDS